MIQLMTTVYAASSGEEDDPTYCADDGDTSFEIDEPEDEEIIDMVVDMAIMSACHNDSDDLHAHNYGCRRTSILIPSEGETGSASCTETSTRSYTVPVVAIRDDPGERSDNSIDSHTASSTPTTADVADITAMVLSPHTGKPLRLSPLQHNKFLSAQENVQAGLVSGMALPDDNISGSIATTITEIEPDVNSSISPNTAARFLGSRVTSQASPLKILAMSTHPSAAFRQADMLPEVGSDKNHHIPSTSSNHQRTLSSSSYRSIASQPSVHTLKPEYRFYIWMKWLCARFKSSGIGEPSVYHALVVIFLEFFAWGLLTMPVISVLNQTFPDHTFLMNGLVMGIKGILSFLSAPLIGALSDIWGRKFFLLITVFFTCAPIPLMTINTWWFFAMISMSGVFAVTFSVVFAYVADVTSVEERSRAYGLVSATFAASLVISPALGNLLMEMYSDTLVVALATAIAVLDVFFILVAVPESLPEKVRPSSWGAPISWEQADPFAALRKVGSDHTILMQCVTVLLSYLPEAGQYSCIFVYLKLKMGFNSMEVAIFIAVVGILSISVQVTLGYLMRVLGAKRTIILGLVLEMMQLLWYGFGSQSWMMWAAGVLAALGSITYPGISAFVSIYSNPDRQGAVQGMVTGMRGLCNGLGPAMFGVIFYLFNVDLNDDKAKHADQGPTEHERFSQLVPGPPFVFGALMVILAILVAIFIPEAHADPNATRAPSEKKRVSLDVQYEIERGHKSAGPLSPLMRSDSLAQL